MFNDIVNNEPQTQQSNNSPEVAKETKSLNLNDCTKPNIKYSNLDKYNRAGKATACLFPENLGKSAGREQQRFKPTGWHQKRMKNGDWLVNRGHLIAYTFSFNFNDKGVYEKGYDGSIDNPLNLVTQTQYSNQIEFPVYEEKVRKALKNGNNVYYQVTPVFVGSNLMASSFKLEAVSEFKEANFNITLLNTQPGYTFDYTTGESKIN